MDKVPDDTRELLERIDKRLRRHAFTVEPIENMIDTWIWTCNCGENMIQLEGESIVERLVAHAKGIES